MLNVVYVIAPLLMLIEAEGLTDRKIQDSNLIEKLAGIPSLSHEILPDSIRVQYNFECDGGTFEVQTSEYNTVESPYRRSEILSITTPYGDLSELDRNLINESIAGYRTIFRILIQCKHNDDAYSLYIRGNLFGESDEKGKIVRLEQNRVTRIDGA